MTVPTFTFKALGSLKLKVMCQFYVGVFLCKGANSAPLLPSYNRYSIKNIFYKIARKYTSCNPVQCTAKCSMNTSFSSEIDRINKIGFTELLVFLVTTVLSCMLGRSTG